MKITKFSTEELKVCDDLKKKLKEQNIHKNYSTAEVVVLENLKNQLNSILSKLKQ